MTDHRHEPDPALPIRAHLGAVAGDDQYPKYATCTCGGRLVRLDRTGPWALLVQVQRLYTWLSWPIEPSAHMLIWNGFGDVVGADVCGLRFEPGPEVMQELAVQLRDALLLED